MSNDTATESLKEKIDDLNRQAWEVRVSDLPKSLELSQESVRLARSINYPKGLAEGLRSLGFSYVRYSKNEQAAPLLKESLSLFQSLNDLKGQAVVYEYLGIIERNWGNLGASLELLLKANEIVLQTGPPEVQITCWYQLGVTYKHLGDHENALDYLYKTLSLAKKINFPLMEAYATNIIGSIYFDNGNYKQALDCYQQGLPVRQQSNDKWGEAGSLDNIGFTYLKLNDLDKAIEYCKQSLAICQGTEDKKGEANAMLHLAEIYQQAGDVKQAAAFSNESLEIRKARGDKRGQTEVLLFLADLYKDRNDVEDDQIFEWLSGALKIAGEIKAQDLLSKAYYDLHEYYRQKGNFKESLVQLEAHFQIEKELHKNNINQKVATLEISHKAEVVGQRNKELTELNEKIEKANEELKIERSLERVRTAAMAMKQPADMLEVCKIISNQLEILDVKKIRNVQTAIFYEEKGVYMNYEYYAKHDKQLITEVNYNNHPVAEKFANQMLKGPNEVFIHGFTGKEVRDWLDYQKTTNVFIDTYLETAESLNYYWYSLGPVALGMSAYTLLNENEIDLFKRFRNVFELAYRRYLDIEKAEAQAREAQVELALERVRARTMAMHHSGELADTASVLFQQIKELGFETWSCGFCTWTIDDLIEVWMAADSGGLLPPMMIPYKEEPTHFTIYEASLRGETTYDKVWEGKELENHYVFLKTIPSVKEAIEILERSGLSLPSRQCYYVGFFKQGYLLLITKEPNADLKEISRRFAKVFDQTYTRFLDLQKAEAQAKEAQIEVALERIRARAMAMHSSNELMDVANILREQMGLLDQPDLETSVVNLFEEDSELIFSWNASRVPGSSEKIISSITSFLKNSSELTREMMSLYHSGEKEYTLEAEGLKLMEFLRVLIKANPRVADYIGNNPPEKVFYHFTTFTGGNLLTVSYQPPSEETKSLQRRAASVFDMAYRRYLDLKKAEAQAREAQIEAALERVRSKTMAMQRSEQLDSVIKTVYSELKHLDVSFDRCFIMIFDEQKGATWWMASPEDDLFHDGFYVQYHTHPPHLAYLKGWEERQQKWEYLLGGQIKKDWDEFLFYKTALSRLPPIAIQYMKSFGSAHLAASFENFGCMTTGGQERLSEESFGILSRFAKVFDQTYTRFNDLKQAEAQTREAKIEAALERVRAKAMAMHKSDDLKPAVATVFEELDKLNLGLLRCGIAILDKDKPRGDIWITIKSGYGNTIEVSGDESLDIHPLLKGAYDAWLKHEDFSYVLQNEDLARYYQAIKKTNFQQPVSATFTTEKKDQQQYYFNAVFQHGSLFAFLDTAFTDEAKTVMKRFANVFNLTYKRFLDLQKAEAQAREAQIETALEKIRSRSLAMHQSKELKEVIAITFEKLSELHVLPGTVAIQLFDQQSMHSVLWVGNTIQDPQMVDLPYDKQMMLEDTLLKDGWQAMTDGVDIINREYSVEQKNKYFNYLFSNNTLTQIPEQAREVLRQMQRHIVCLFVEKNSAFLVDSWTGQFFPKENLNVLKRAAKVFEQAYIRFLDLQKAEAQAKEAQIEAALERVRSRSMAMHKSDELREVVAVLFAQLQHLGFDIKFCTIALIDKINSTVEFWLSGFSQEILPESYHVPNLDHPFYRNFHNTFRQGIPYKVFELVGEEKKSYDKLWFSVTDFKNLPEPVKKPMMEMERVIMSCAFTKNGMIQIGGFEPLSKANATIVQRFAKVFEQTYTRFLDLQKAEAQVREAKIEAALERARTQSMIMQHSKELDETLRVFHEQVLLLGIHSAFSFLWLPDEDKERHIFWAAWAENVSNDPLAKKDSAVLKSKAINYALDRKEPATAQCLVDWKGKEPVISYRVPPAEVVRYFAAWQELISGVEQLKPEYFSNGLYYVEAFMKYGCFGVMVASDLTEDEKKILLRFTIEFERTYTRFLDLQKAEAQAREAQIEAALEKVRAKVMAMTSSKDLNETSLVFGDQLRKLNIDWQFSYFWLIDESKKENTFWITWPDYRTSVTNYTLAEAEQYFNDCLISWRAGVKIHDNYVPPEGVQEWLDTFQRIADDAGGVAKEIMVAPTFPTGVYYYDAMMKYGSFGICISTPATDEEKNIQCRFAIEFERAYTRFLDLQKAEAQAREAKIETALERVRGRALAMQEPEELKDVAQVLRTEMGLLGVQELETCSIYINDLNAEKAECWYALKDIRSEQKKLVNDHFALDLNDTWVGREMLQFYQSPEKQTSIVMQGGNRKEWISYCEERSALLRGYYGEVIPDRTYHLYKFSHGAIGAAAAGDISEESWRMLSRVASVFSLAYSRFKDLTQARTDLIKLKEEKKRAEDALTELQATQKQLIQSEKMASLGELTAGIAHEIQNPLNFVNNFSDVSNELLEEMKAELEKGNAEGAKEIATDVKENLEKILHHGKRADAIVKGMLQHSRSSSGQKELTDINILTEEYLRLAYHGLRAKDKFFNAKFETDLDPSIDKINIVPQEIGRVILNLVNNSFYAVTEKKKKAPPAPEGGIGYEPVVTVTTRRHGDPSGDGGTIEIKVADNGIGIAKKDLDKIFQPFFTTKPTGQGTGLGLSLSYDIITQGHDGEIKVETKPGEGSSFTIRLPMK